MYLPILKAHFALVVPANIQHAFEAAVGGFDPPRTLARSLDYGPTSAIRDGDIVDVFVVVVVAVRGEFTS